MKVVSLAAGAGGMFCGSCLRDNRLAATLVAQGRDLTLIPLYTPLRSDESVASSGAVYYGGINVYLHQQSAILRHLPSVVERWLDSPRLLRRIDRLAGKTRIQDLGALTVSILRGEQGHQRRDLENLISALKDAKPDVVNLPNLMFTGIAAQLQDQLDAAIVCTLSGEDIFVDQLPQPYKGQAMALIKLAAAHIDGFISLTRYYAKHASDHFGLPAGRIHYVPMGLAKEDLAGVANPPDQPFTIGYLGRICPEKGLANLCDALGRLVERGYDCRLQTAGYLGEIDRPYFNSVCDSIREKGLQDRFDYRGEVDKAGKHRFLSGLHAFSLPTDYHEAKGFPVLEAMAAGVPVVQPSHGSFPELIEATQGGVLYDPADPEALSNGLASLMDNAELRSQLGAQGRAAVADSFTAELMAEACWACYERILKCRPSNA